MKKWICCFVAFFLCILTMPVCASENEFVYNGMPYQIDGAIVYYDVSGEELSGAPTEVGSYFALLDNDSVYEFTIVPAKLRCVVQNSNLYYGQSIPAFSYVLYNDANQEVLDFPLLHIMLDVNNMFYVASNPNYEVEFEPMGITYQKRNINIEHADMEFTYTGNPIVIRYENTISDLDVLPIYLLDVGEYEVFFKVRNTLNYNIESKSFKVRILPKNVWIHPGNRWKYAGQKDPTWEDNADYKLTRQQGENVGCYAYVVMSKNKNYTYRVSDTDVFEIKERPVQTGRNENIALYIISGLASLACGLYVLTGHKD